MGGKIRIRRWLGVCLAAFFIAGCQKPQLRSDDPEETGDEEKVVAETPVDDYSEIRKKVIGRRFETLTLGSKRFGNAEVRDINDKEIVIAHAEGVDKIPWSEVPDEVREKWGYNPSSDSLMAKITKMLPKKEEPPARVGKPKSPSAESEKADKPEVDRKSLVEEIDRKRRMLEAQLTGIRNIESDLARHSQQLDHLRRQLQSIKAQQSRTRSGGIFVERVDGKSTVVDRRNEAAEVQEKLNTEEQLVAQFTKSLQSAQIDYQKLKRELDGLMLK